ncbi:acyl-CoA dehydrogenase family protein [Solibacillus silvestris]|uniref:acyl-CoA dehydrogenase family protein n=1 Tax=Solibacillus silvestris TaxID=76853 RepID=UPI003F8164CE
MGITTQTKNYSFTSFIQQRNVLNDWDNPFLQQVLKSILKEGYEALEQEIAPYVQKLSTTWREVTDELARPENSPKIRHYNAYNERIDRIIRPLEAVRLTEEIFNGGLFAKNNLPYEGITKRYFLHGNGEAGITCPLACTDGLIALIEAFYKEVPQPVKEIYEHAKNGRNGQFAVGAQFMSEIQGGSNIPANVLKAVSAGDHYLLYGNKFFCSAVHADYSVVTARVDGTDDVAVFVVPTWLEGDKEKEKRNHHTVNRLKWKLGTSELPSGEIDYDGAIAYRIGPQNRGVALAVSVVLTRSRLDIGFSSAAFVMRAAREAMLYAKFRQVFDRKIEEFPMAAAQLEDLQDAAKRMAATAFTVYERFLAVEDNSASLQAFAAREVILLQKIYASKEAVEKLRLAISIFGGHGAIEDFSSIPRLFRDSMVNELWEGPRNVLLAQIYRDLHKMLKTVALRDILTAMFPNLETGQLQDAEQELSRIMQIDLTALPNAQNRQAARRWEQIWESLFLAYQQQIVKDFEYAAILPESLFSQI